MTILFKKGKSQKMLVERNGPTAVISVQSSKIDLSSDKAICLPANLGLEKIEGNRLQMLNSAYNDDDR